MTPDNYTAGEEELSPTVSLGDWLLTFLLAALPLVGFVLLCMWAFGRTTPPSKTTWARAVLLLYAVVLAIGLVLWLAFIVLSWSARPGDQVMHAGPSYKVVP